METEGSLPHLQVPTSFPCPLSSARSVQYMPPHPTSWAFFKYGQ